MVATSSSHKRNIVTSTNCAEADLTFVMAYAHIWAESEQFVANSTSVLFFPPLCITVITRARLLAYCLVPLQRL